jgi:phosphoethanolamine N-methyltransferase
MAEQQHEDEYTDELIALLELVWGKGFLSPGGPAAVAAIVRDNDLKDKQVLDIGCRLGGIELVLARDYGARVTGIDIEAGLVRRANELMAREGLTDRVDCRLVEPGPLPFEDGAFDVVFGKDSWIHIEDKAGFFAEVLRVLKPGGQLLAGDWMRSDKPYGKDMEYFFEMEGLTYHMDTIENYGAIIHEAGFSDVELEDIAEAYRVQGHREYPDMQGRLKPAMIDALGEDGHAHFEENWRAMTVVLDSGELRPGRFWARRPV